MHPRFLRADERHCGAFGDTVSESLRLITGGRGFVSLATGGCTTILVAITGIVLNDTVGTSEARGHNVAAMLAACISTGALDEDAIAKRSWTRDEDLPSRASRAIAERAVEPGFRIRELATFPHISERHLQRLFARTGTTPSEVIRAERVDGWFVATVKCRMIGLWSPSLC